MTTRMIPAVLLGVGIFISSMHSAQAQFGSLQGAFQNPGQALQDLRPDKQAEEVRRRFENEARRRMDQVRQYSMPVAANYIAHLNAQASGRYRSLPPELIRILAPQYPRTDLGRVRYAENIDTIHGQAITIGDRIYFPTSIDLRNTESHFYWLLHELEHVGQYRAHGGVEPFLVKYLTDGAIKITQRRCINVHDSLALERDADNKVSRIGATCWQRWRGTMNVGQTSGSLPVAHPGVIVQDQSIWVMNRTTFVITYQVSVNGGPAQSLTVLPGQEFRHSVRTAGARYRVAFDASLEAGNQVVSYDLLTGSHNDFQAQGNRVDLFRRN